MAYGQNACSSHPLSSLNIVSSNDRKSSDISGNPIVCFACDVMCQWVTTSYCVGSESETLGSDRKTL